MADDQHDRDPFPDDDTGVPSFPIALRGYDRDAVAAFAARSVREVGALRRELAAQLQRSTDAEAQLAAVRRENQALREGYTLPARETVPPGTGARLERLLEAAEDEAAAVRAAGVRDATRLLEQARQQADTHLRATADEIDQQRLAQDEEARRRRADLRADEQRTAARLQGVRDAAERHRADAEARARQVLADADADADAVRARAHAEADLIVARARVEVERLASVGRSAREDLARLLAAITTGLPGRGGVTGAATGDAGPVGPEPDGPDGPHAAADPDARTVPAPGTTPGGRTVPRPDHPDRRGEDAPTATGRPGDTAPAPAAGDAHHPHPVPAR